jgi:hypothetical protein
MVQAANLQDCDDSAARWRLDGTRVWTVFVQGKMGSGSLVVVLVRRKDASQMALIEDYAVVETLTPDRADDPLDIRVLPR